VYLFIANELVPHIVQAQHIDSRSHHLQPLPRGFAGWQPAHHATKIYQVYVTHWHISLNLTLKLGTLPRKMGPCPCSTSRQDAVCALRSLPSNPVTILGPQPHNLRNNQLPTCHAVLNTPEAR
jgi:hypothetical protein